MMNAVFAADAEMAATQFSLPMQKSAATQFSLPILDWAAMQFSLPILDWAATQPSLPIQKSVATQFSLLISQWTVTQSWEGGVKQILDKPNKDKDTPKPTPKQPISLDG